MKYFEYSDSAYTDWASTDRRKSPRFCITKQRQFQLRIQLVDEILDPSLVLTQEEYNDQWLPLRKKLHDFSQIRNIIAHQPALRTHTAKRGKAAYLYSIHIEPYQLLSRKPNPLLKGKNSLQISDLKQHAKDVDQLVAELASFLKRLNQAHQRA